MILETERTRLSVRPSVRTMIFNCRSSLADDGTHERRMVVFFFIIAPRFIGYRPCTLFFTLVIRAAFEIRRVLMNRRFCPLEGESQGSFVLDARREEELFCISQRFSLILYIFCSDSYFEFSIVTFNSSDFILA